MKLLLKTIAWLIGIAVVLVVAAVVVLPIVVDPNDYKERIASTVQEQTGRTVRLAGDIGFSVFPKLALELGEAGLGNAPGFEEPEFASVKRVQVGLRWLPLLDRRIEMDELVLHGLQVRLSRDAQGKGNWEDLVQPQEGPAGEAPSAEEPAPGSGPEAPAIAGLALGGVDIRDARVVWDDRMTGQRYALEDFNLQTGPVTMGRPVDLKLSLRATGGAPAVTAALKMKATLLSDLGKNTHRVKDLTLETQLSGEPVPAGEMRVALSAPLLNADLNAQTATISELQIETLGMKLKTDASAEQILSEPQYNALIKLADFSPKELLERLGQPPLETSDPAVLAKASMNARLAGTATRARLEPLTLALDESTLEGHVEVADFKGPALRFDLRLDAIDADRYLPPPAEKGTAPAAPTPGAAASAGGTGGELPMEQLRALDVDGKFSVGRLKVAKLTMTDVVLVLKGKDGVIKLSPVDAQLYQGSYRGDITLDARGRTPAMSLNERLTAVQAGPLLADLLGQERLLGTTSAQAKLRFAGTQPEAVKKSLNGTANFLFRNGAVKGVNIAKLIRDTKARLKGEPVSQSAEPNQTDFTELGGSVRIADGVVRNEDLEMKSPLLRIDGEGKVDLVREDIDYLLTTLIVGTTEGQGGKELEELEGLKIPVRVDGSFQDPDFHPDLRAALEEETKREVQEKLEKKIDKKLEGEQGERAKEILRGLFN